MTSRTILGLTLIPVAVGMFCGGYVLGRCAYEGVVHHPEIRESDADDRLKEKAFGLKPPLEEGEITDVAVSSFTVDKGTIGDCLLALSEKAGTPIGIELLAEDWLDGSTFLPDGTPVGKGPRFTITEQNTTVGALLDRFISADPRYKWQDKRGVIEVYPSQQSEVARAYLDQTIDAFAVLNLGFDETLSLLLAPLNSLQYLRTVLPDGAHDAKLEFEKLPLLSDLSRAKTKWQKPMTFILVKPALRDILNAILRSQGSGNWVLSPPPPSDPKGGWRLKLCAQ